MAWVELIDKRTQKTKVFQDPLNSQRHQLIACIHDQHYKDGQGNWQDAVEAWDNDGADGFDFSMSRLRHRVRLVQLTGVLRYHPIGSAPLKYVTVGRPERKGLGQTWPSMILGVRSQDGNLMSFDTTDHGYDVQSTWNTVKTYYRLKDNTAPKRVRWSITFNNLAYDHATREVRDGSTVVSHLKPTIAWDANGAPVVVTESWDGSYLELNIDTTGAVFPVTIDPTFTSQPDATAGLDNTVIGTAPDTNFATLATFRFDGNNNRGLIKFDLSTLTGVTVTSAMLSLWKNTGGTNQTVSTYRIHADNASWTEAGSTWNYRIASSERWAGDAASDGGTDAGCSVSGTDYYSPAMGSFSWVGADAADAQYDTALDATQMESLIAANNGMVVIGSATNANSQARSSDYATDATKRPKLVVEYTTGGGLFKGSLSLLGVGI